MLIVIAAIDNLGKGAAGQAIQNANERGFVVNVSADSVGEADQLAELGVGPRRAPRRGGRPRRGRRVLRPARKRTMLDKRTC